MQLQSTYWCDGPTLRVSDAFFSSTSRPIIVVASLRLITAVNALIAATASARSGLLRHESNSWITLNGFSLTTSRPHDLTECETDIVWSFNPAYRLALSACNSPHTRAHIQIVQNVIWQPRSQLSSYMTNATTVAEAITLDLKQNLLPTFTHV